MGVWGLHGNWRVVPVSMATVGSPDYVEGISSGGTRSSDLMLPVARSWGCGAFTATGEWFQFQWPQSEVQIMLKELAVVVLGVAI